MSARSKTQLGIQLKDGLNPTSGYIRRVKIAENVGSTH